MVRNPERARSRRASESKDAQERWLAKDRARRRLSLASETAEERETRLSRRFYCIGKSEIMHDTKRPSTVAVPLYHHSTPNTARMNVCAQIMNHVPMSLAKDRARRRPRLASETAEERETRLSP